MRELKRADRLAEPKNRPQQFDISDGDDGPNFAATDSARQEKNPSGSFEQLSDSTGYQPAQTIRGSVPRPRAAQKAVLLVVIAGFGLLLLGPLGLYKVIRPAITFGLLVLFFASLAYVLVRLSIKLFRRGFRKIASLLMIATLGLVLYPVASAYVISYDPIIDESLKVHLPPRMFLTFSGSDGDKDFLITRPLERSISPDEIAKSWLKPAIIGIEDERLSSRVEGPIDYIATARAILSNLKGRRQGGSTIQLQIAKLIMGKLKTRLSDKDTQTLLAIRIDQRFDIDQLLALYCSLCSIDGNARGIAFAATDLFGIYDLRELTIAQSALLAGMLRSPAEYNPRQHLSVARERRDLVLKKMHEQQSISDVQYSQSLKEPIQTQPKLKTFDLFIRAALDLHQIKGKLK